MPTTIDIGKRTEEVQDIIERMPNKFGKYVTMIVVGIFLLLLLFGWLVRYPDVVTGEVTVNANQAPIKLISFTAGKLKLAKISSQDQVKENQIVAHIENATDLQHALKIKALMEQIKLPIANAASIYSSLPKEAPLGELSTSYFNFLNAVKLLADYQTNHLFEKQEQALHELITQQKSVLEASAEKTKISIENQKLYNNFYNRDSILFTKKVLSASDFDKTKINSVGAKDVYQSTLRDIANSKEKIAQTQSQLQEVIIQKTEKEQQLDLDVLTTHNDMLDKLRSWEQQYVFRAPLDGKIQFLKFWNSNQFVQSGEEVFTVVPKQQHALGQVILPAQGAGKVEVGQEVIVKLEDYPYMEYGSVTGKVKNISLTTNASKTEKGEIQNYLVLLNFPDDLKTNYGRKLDFRYEIKGSAEIITKDRRLIQRFFDNLKYIVEK